MDAFKCEKNTLRELVRAREAIKRKHNLLKNERADFEKAIGETFKPVIDPLEKLVSYKEESSPPPPPLSFMMKEEPKVKSFREISKKMSFSDQKPEIKQFDESNVRMKFIDGNKSANSNQFQMTDDLDESFASVTNNVINSTFKSIPEQNPSSEESVKDKYLKLLDDSIKNEMDNIYGVKKAGGTYMLGNSQIKFDRDMIIVNNHIYPKSNGLMELIFKRQPDQSICTSSDQENYRNILEATSAHRVKHNQHGKLRTSKSAKYKNIILPMFTNSKSESNKKGGSLLPRYKTAKLNSNIDYVYWEDPNEIIDRLRLLIAERTAGNNSHDNEIHSIVEELRESGYIY